MMKENKYSKATEKDEESEDTAKYRLPFALCKQRGIEIQKWWTPSDAWSALQGRGVNPELEYERMYEKRLSSEASKLRKKAKNAQMEKAEHNPDWNYQSADNMIAGIPKGEPMNFEQADNNQPNPYYGKAGLFGYSTNCQTCVVAFEARQRGYDVRALPNLRNPYINDVRMKTNLVYLDKDGKHPDYISRKKAQPKTRFLFDSIEEGGRYTLEFAWSGARSGHIISAYKDQGVVKLYDPQTGKKYENDKDINTLLSRTKNEKLLRVDNVEFDQDYVDHMLKGATK